MEKDEWICTDPDRDQYGKQISERIYEFKEKNRFPNNEEEWIERTINLNNYTEIDIFEMLSPYYHRMEIERLLTGGEDDDEWIIAECIFEQESGLY